MAELLVCADCKKPIGKARVVIQDLLVCPDCVYKREHPEFEQRQRQQRVAIQKEALFDGSSYKRIDR